MIGISFFIARGFIKTGLGKPYCFLFIRVFGKSSLGLAYGLGLADVCLAPAIPSNTARGGGIIYPIMKSMAISFDSVPENRKPIENWVLSYIEQLLYEPHRFFYVPYRNCE
jgi:DASS family divalent anion:Na+ symporter